MFAIVRPGPYICSEWEFGGLPWWLLKYDNIELRCMNDIYLSKVDAFFDRIIPVIASCQIENGGSVIMVQVENEYGSYGDDSEYIRYIASGLRLRGITCELFTSDGDCDFMLTGGTVPEIFKTCNFGSGAQRAFANLRKFQPEGPLMCTEFWNGWFDHIGEEHHTRDANDYAACYAEMLEKASGVNLYMFRGGTNFGFTSGANHYEKFAPDVTSYDYDAVLSECGDVTPKYHALREVISKYVDTELPEIPKNREKRSYGKVALTEVGGFFDNLDRLSSPVFSNVPKCMENYGHGYGYIAYRTTLNRDYDNKTLYFESLGDRAQVYINKDLCGIVYINDDELKVNISAKAGDVLTILCENMGRANFGPKMMRKKGIAGRCLLDGKIHFNWDVYPLPMDNLDKVVYGKEEPKEKSCFYRGSFSVDHLADTFLYLDNFTKGFVTINGFNIGRYWEIGPQRSLYVPASLLREGENEIVVFESDGIKGEGVVEFLDYPTLE
jgi:beta-galactosidase